MDIKKVMAGVTAAVLMGSLAGCSTPGSSKNKDKDEDKDTASVSTEAGGDSADDDDEGGSEGGSSSSGDALTAVDFDAPPVQLVCYSQLANYSGKLTGWFAEVLKAKFNVEMTIIPETDGMFDTRMESGNLGDICIFGSNGGPYQRAAAEGMLFDWNEDDILSDYGPYIKEHMPKALETNALMNEKNGAGNHVFGFGHNVASNPEDHEAFFYTLDIRWDLYKELGYPEVKDLDGLYDLFVKMKEISPTDENGRETYALSLWPDWDGNMVMYVKAFATAYWGYDEMGFGLYDTETGTYHDALEENGPYLTSLKFFNKLFQAGLIDPNSMTQTYNEMSEKVQAGGTFFSIFDYAGSALYNTEPHLEADKAMYPMVPKDATPLAYGMNVMGGNRIWTIGANTEYPELCMEIINYLCTPEGYMTYWWGPKDGFDENHPNGCWYYDENGNTCFTELGEAAYKDRKGTMMPAEWGGGSFNDGTFQANNTTWSRDASNPDSNGETYNCENWKSRRTQEAQYDILSDWRDWSGQYNSQDYMNTVNFKVAPASDYAEKEQSDELKLVWEQVAKCIVQYSWQAIYAKDDAEYDKIVAEMIKTCEEYDPDGICLAHCLEEAKTRHERELFVNS